VAIIAVKDEKDLTRLEAMIQLKKEESKEWTRERDHRWHKPERVEKHPLALLYCLIEAIQHRYTRSPYRPGFLVFLYLFPVS